MISDIEDMEDSTIIIETLFSYTAIRVHQAVMFQQLELTLKSVPVSMGAKQKYSVKESEQQHCGILSKVRGEGLEGAAIQINLVA